TTVATAVSLRPQAGTVPDLADPAPSAEGGNRFVLAATTAGYGPGRVDELSDTRREIRLLVRRLIRGDLAGRLRGVDLGGRVGDEGADEPITALSCGRVRDLGERLARAELRLEICFGHTEVRRRRSAGVADDVPAAGPAAEAWPGAFASRGLRARADALLVDERRDVLLLRRGESGDEPGARLAVGDRHIGEALVGAQLGPELRFGDTDIGGRGREVRALAHAVSEHLADGLIPYLRDRRGSATAGKESGRREPARKAEPDDCRYEKRLSWLHRFHAIPFPRSCLQ